MQRRECPYCPNDANDVCARVKDGDGIDRVPKHDGGRGIPR